MHRFAMQAQALRKLLEASTDVVEPWVWFQERFAGAPEFFGMGVAREHPRLWAVVRGIGSRFFGPAVAQPYDRVLAYVSELKLWHGACRLGPHATAVFYFDDIDHGLTAMLRAPSELKLQLVRFRMMPEAAAGPARLPAGWGLA